MAPPPDDADQVKRLMNVPRPRPGADPARLDWRLLAACRSIDPDLFFPVSSAGKALAEADKAKAVCARCLVQDQCLAFAVQTRQAHGIWGGLTEEERHRKPLDQAPDRDLLHPPATA
jgi:WhiB family transcriptional regulator, redox-sensing transcriptional regulator